MRAESRAQIDDFVRRLNEARPIDVSQQEQIEELAELANVVVNAAPVGLFLYFEQLRGCRVISIEDEYSHGPVAIVLEVHDELGSRWELFT